MRIGKFLLPLFIKTEEIVISLRLIINLLPLKHISNAVLVLLKEKKYVNNEVYTELNELIDKNYYTFLWIYGVASLYKNLIQSDRSIIKAGLYRR